MFLANYKLDDSIFRSEEWAAVVQAIDSGSLEARSEPVKLLQLAPGPANLLNKAAIAWLEAEAKVWSA